MANAAIYRNISSTSATSAKKYSMSIWFKRSRVGVEEAIWAGWTSSTNRCQLRFKSDDTIDLEYGIGGSWYSLITNRKFRDSTAWYHFVFEFDSTQAVSSNREKFYVNGVQETSFSTETYVPQDTISQMSTSGDEVMIGCANQSSSAGTHHNYCEGLISQVNFTDGIAYPASTFGSFNSTDGMWEINTAPTVTYGTNGFFLKMEDSSNLDLDSSSPALTFTSEGSLTAAKDNPSNNFCILNPGKRSSNGTNTFSNANTIFSNTGGTGWHQSGGTISATKGKYYYEADINYTPGSLNTQFGWGAVDMQQITLNLNNPLGKLDVSGGSIVNYAPSTGFYDTGAYMYSTISSQDNQVNSSFAAATSGSVIMIAIDLDNGKFYVGKDGTWDSTSSSDPSAGTGGKSFTPGGFNYAPWVASYNAGPVSINFGNGYFGATAIGSPVSGGEGLWKYAPPTGYGAFCTKNINSA